MSSRAVGAFLSNATSIEKQFLDSLPEVRKGVVDKSKRPTASSWMNLVPIIGIVAAGSLLFPTFSIGVPVGVINYCAVTTSAYLLHSMGILTLKEDKNSIYAQWNRTHPFTIGIALPILEELLFRGCLQTGLVSLARYGLPLRSISSPLFSPIALADLVAITTTSAVFGLVHATNDNPNAWYQALFAMGSGFVFGMLMHSYGIVAPIGAHIANNCFGFAVSKWFESPPLTHKQITKV